MIKAVIFDFGRVISAQKPMSLFGTYEKELGIEPDTLNRIMFGSEAWQDALVGRKTSAEFWRVIGPQLNLHTQAEIDAFRRRYRSDEALNEGVAGLIRRLHGRYKLAVLSNSPPGLSRWLDEWSLLDLFDVVFCSGDEGVAKPEPAAFEITLGRLDVEPGDAVFVDDTLRHVEAARRVGVHAILFTTAEALAKDLKELIREK